MTAPATRAEVEGLIERLEPRHTSDEPIAMAVVSNDQAVRREAVNAYLVANNAIKSAAAAMLARLSPAPDTGTAGEVAVKALEWQRRTGTDIFEAETPFNKYVATINDDNEGYWRLQGVTRGNKCDPDLNEVFTAAQADYESRIRSALTSSPPLAGTETEPTPGERLIKGAKEALAIARGEIPAARLHIDGHSYVPLADLQKESRLREEEYQIALHIRQEQHAKLDAADALVKELAEALEPFAGFSEEFNDWCPDETPAWWRSIDGLDAASSVTVGDFRRADAALARSRAEGI